MKTAIIIVLMSALAAIYGCQSSSPRGGSMTKDEGFNIAVPTFTTDIEQGGVQSATISKDAGFKIAVPTFTTDIKQGGVQSVTISLERGKYFKQDVMLQIEASNGISLDPTSVLIKSGDRSEEHIQITVARDVALGEYGIRVIGTPETGEPTSTVFNVKIVSSCGCLSAGSV
jgi:uncharacterized membrane protein